MSLQELACRKCGCKQHTACLLILRGKMISSCSWVEKGLRPLCSACVEPAQLDLPALGQLPLPKVKAGPGARWVRHQRGAHIAAAMVLRKVRL